MTAFPLPRLGESTAERLLGGYVSARHPAWSVLIARGDRLLDYLQGQITQDVRRLSPEQAIHACLLTPQGKPVAELYLLQRDASECWLLVPSAALEAAQARLKRFMLGYALDFEPASQLAVFSIQGAHAGSGLARLGLPEPGSSWLSLSTGPEGMALVMPASPRGFWAIGPARDWAARLAGTEIAAEELEAMRILRGLPRFGVEWDERTHPLNANLIEFDGVSFDKGCYVGQEVTSRMRWRGGIRRRLYQVQLAAPPDSMPARILSTQPIGELKSAAMDHEGAIYGIASLPIAVAETEPAPSLRLENGADVRLIGPCRP